MTRHTSTKNRQHYGKKSSLSEMAPVPAMQRKNKVTVTRKSHFWITRSPPIQGIAWHKLTHKSGTNNHHTPREASIPCTAKSCCHSYFSCLAHTHPGKQPNTCSSCSTCHWGFCNSGI